MDAIDKFLNEQGIRHVETKRMKMKTYNIDDLKNYIDILGEFHSRTSNISGEHLLSLPSNLGKNIRRLIIQERKNYKYFVDIKKNNDIDDFDKIVVSDCMNIFEDAYKIIHDINSDKDYLKLLYRSMCNNEVCVGDGNIENIFIDDGLCISNTQKICIDMIEWDFINLVVKMKKRRIYLDYDLLTDIYVKNESLDDTSREFINKMIHYPWEFMKICQRKRERSIEESCEYYQKKLMSLLKTKTNIN